MASFSASTSTSTSTITMDDFSTAVALPQGDMLQEILLRLDVKSITRFKLISKTWKEFISSPYFSKLYSNFRPPITSFFYETCAQEIQYVPLHPNQEPIIDPPACLGFLDQTAVLVNSCNGLLHWRTHDDKHFISNPLNNKFVPIDWPFTKVFASGIAFDPSDSDRFEVVVLFKNSGTSNCLMSKSFSSGIMEWGLEKKTVTDFKSKPFCLHRGVLINGVLYWELKNSTLLAYNVKDRNDWLIKLPISSGELKKLNIVEPGCLGESNGILHYARVLGTMLIVFEQSTENSARWRYMHTVWASPRIKSGLIQVLAFLDGCQGVLVSIENKITAYNLEDSSEKEVCQVRPSGKQFTCVQPSMFFPFVHTMALSNFRSVQIIECIGR